MRSFLKSKIHRATVTHADLHYEGSLSIDRSLMAEADIAAFEEVHVWNISRGTRLTTYAIEADKDSGIICANGAAAHHIHQGDLIIIATFIWVAQPTASSPPRVVRVDAKNRVILNAMETAGPATVAQYSCTR